MTANQGTEKDSEREGGEREGYQYQRTAQSKEAYWFFFQVPFSHAFLRHRNQPDCWHRPLCVTRHSLCCPPCSWTLSGAVCLVAAHTLERRDRGRIPSFSHISSHSSSN